MSERKTVGLALVIDYKDQEDEGLHVPDLKVIDLKSLYVINDTLYVIQTESFDNTPLSQGGGEYLTGKQIREVIERMEHAIPKEQYEFEQEEKEREGKTDKLLVTEPQ